MANVDLLFIILSAAKPKPDYLLADKLAIYGLYNHIDVAIGVNKVDVGSLDEEIRCSAFFSRKRTGAKRCAHIAER